MSPLVWTFLLSMTASVCCQSRVVCYWSSWSTYREEPGNFEVSDIDPNICTHAVYHTALIDTVTYEIIPGDAYNDLEENGGKGNYAKFNAMKTVNPELKTMLSCQPAAQVYSAMASTPETRTTFVDSVVAFLPMYGFDGLDIDWFYPEEGDDQVNFISLLNELREAFNVYGFILSAQVASSQQVVTDHYQNVPGMAGALDFFNVMTYDFHGAWDPITGHHTQMDDPDGEAFTVSATMENWFTQGASREKLNVGIPCYGRGWRLESAAETGLGAPTIEGLPQGPFSWTTGLWYDFEFCMEKNVSTWETVYDPTVVAPYSYSGDLWIGHDDRQSAIEKANFILSNTYGGSFVFSLDSCDFFNGCNDGRFPIVDGLYKTLVSSGDSEK